MVYKRRTKKKSYSKPASSGRRPSFAIKGTIPFINRDVDISLFRRAMNDTIQKDKECKRKLLQGTVVALLHDTHYSRNPLGNINFGTTEITRESDEIFLCSYKGTQLLQWTLADAFVVNPMVRIMLVRIQEDTGSGTGTDAWSAAVGSTQLYHQGTTASNITQSITDPKRCQKLFDKLITLQRNYAGHQPTVTVPFNITFNHNFQYKPASNVGTKYTLYWVACAYTASGSTGVTTVASITETSQLLFKDK